LLFFSTRKDVVRATLHFHNIHHRSNGANSPFQ
jgi:hypothetical protein